MASEIIPTLRRAFKYRIYPTKAQAATLTEWLARCCELHNAAIEERRGAWRQGASIRFRQQSAQLPELKKLRPEYAEINAQVLQQALRRVDGAFQGFFRRVKAGAKPGYPRFQSRDRYDSLTWPQASNGLFRGKKLKLWSLGEVRIKMHRSLSGRPKTITVKREGSRWYAVVSCDQVEARVFPKAEAEVGIDLGLKVFATLSTGESIENPRWQRVNEERVKKAQQDMTRKKRGSKRRKKNKARLGAIRAKERNHRSDFQHKLAHRVICENASIAVEDLAPTRIIERSPACLSKSIHDAGWSAFLTILEAKAEEAGRRFVRVPARGTTSTCSDCGAFRQKALSERIHECLCGLVLDRDLNAARNILRLGRSLRGCIPEKPLAESRRGRHVKEKLTHAKN